MPDSITPNPSYRRIVAALRDSDDRYRVLVEAITRYAIFMLDANGAIVTWNEGIRGLFGYDAEDVLGKSGAALLSPEERAKGSVAMEMEEAREIGEAIRNREGVRKDGTKIHVTDVLTALHNAKGELVGFAKVCHRTDRPSDTAVARDVAEVELATALGRIQAEVDHRHRLESQLLTAVDQERERLGRDLHDDFSQRLAGIALMAAVVSKKIAPINPSLGKEALKVSKLISEAGETARDLTHGLQPITVAEQGLPAASEELATKIPERVKFSWPRTKRLPLKPAVALHAYRIVEEAVGNALKHSGADKIEIDLKIVSPRKAMLSITDNGKGFDAGGKRRAGMGLQNMKYRANAVQSGLTIENLPTGGISVKCALPLQTAENRELIEPPVKARKPRPNSRSRQRAARRKTG